MITSYMRIRSLIVLFVLTMSQASGSPAAASGLRGQSDPGDTAAILAVDKFSPAFLGVYRKVMEIEDDIVRYSSTYGVDPSLARAVCMYESGGNANLTSGAGARGYFQVMPATFRLMRVPTNIEAGIKYLGQLVEQFGREDYALAAYNGGPGRVARGRGMPLESLQYVRGVGAYRSALKLYEPSIRAHAAELTLVTSRPGDDWWTLSHRLDIPMIQLRLYNPFLSDERLKRAPRLIAYPQPSRDDLFGVAPDGGIRYRARIGDNYFNLASAFGADLDDVRTSNELWRLQPLPPGMLLTIPLDAGDAFAQHRVHVGEGLVDIAARWQTDPWQLVRDNHLWSQDVRAGMVLRVRQRRPAVQPASLPPVRPTPPRPAYTVHRVIRGENLTGIARRYGTTITAIQRANSLGRRTVIRVGERLRIPAR